MATESPIRDIMIEIITDERVGLPAIRAAGDVIAADAAVNIRMADAHGHSTLSAMTEAVGKYKATIDVAANAWCTFKEASSPHEPFRSAPNEALEQALTDVRRALDRVGVE
jgi:hypothetical protein